MSRYSSTDPIKQATNNQIVRNLKEKHPILNNWSDKDVFDAWDQWSESEDYPNEQKLIELYLPE
jgi:hypothetical protein